MAKTLFTDKFYYQLLELYNNKILSGDIKIGLLSDVSNVGSGTLSYADIVATGDELPTENGYVVGGKAIENGVINGLELTCSNPIWTNSTFPVVKGAFIYDDTNANEALKYVLAVIDFESIDGLSSNNSTFELGLNNNILIKLK